MFKYCLSRLYVYYLHFGIRYITLHDNIYVYYFIMVCSVDLISYICLIFVSNRIKCKFVVSLELNKSLIADCAKSGKNPEEFDPSRIFARA